MTPRGILLSGLGLVSAALVAVIAFETTGTPVPPSAVAPPPPPLGLPVAADADVQALVPVILARPLFSPDRRPKAGPAAVGVTDDMPRLAGMLIDRSDRHAIFQPTGDAKPVIVAVGDQVGGYKVQEITAEAVTLAGPKGTLVLQPKPDPSLVNATPAQALPGIPPRPGPNVPRQTLPGGMQLPPGVANPFAGQATPTPAVPNANRQPGGAPAAPNRR